MHTTTTTTKKSLSFIVTAVVYSIMLPQLIAKYVFGMEDFLYANDKENVNSIIHEVTSLSDLTFETSTKPRIVEFYSPYCGHCIHFKKTYIQVAKQAYERYTNDAVEFYAISCAAVDDLCTKYSIQAYPSLYAVPAGISMFDSRTLLKNNDAYSLKDVENVVNSDNPVDAKQRRAVKEVKENDKNEDDDGKSEPEDNSEGDDGKPETEDADGEGYDEGKQDENGDDGEQPNRNRGKNQKEGNGDEGDDIKGNRSSADDGHDEKDEDKRGTAEFEDEFEKFRHDGRNSESIQTAESPLAGAEYAKSLPKSMDQWKNILKQRLREREYKWLRQKQAKPGSLGQDFIQNTETDGGATDAMLANRKGTKEYTARQSKLLMMIAKMKSYGRRRKNENPQEIENQLSEGQLPYKKGVSPMRIVERIPIIKHAVRMSLEEELILDASLSFIAGLRVGVYKTDEPLPAKKKEALRDWLDLVHISLPPEWALHDTIDDLIHNLDHISKGKTELKQILEQHNLQRQKWSRSCSRENAFSCGFWKLLHTMTVGTAEFRGGQDLIASGSVRPGTRVFSPSEAADTVREYMAYFFPCTECSKHFVGQYDQCETNRRCNRLTTDPSTSSDADWKQLATWLWEVHNDVNVRLLTEAHEAKKRRRQKSLSETEQIKAIWPTLTDCFKCLKDDGSFDEDVIFLHLEETYWPGHDLKDTPRRLLFFEDDGQGAIGLNLIFLLIGLIIVALCQKSISRASFAQTMSRAKAMGTRVVDGGKVRTV